MPARTRAQPFNIARIKHGPSHALLLTLIVCNANVFIGKKNHKNIHDKLRESGKAIAFKRTAHRASWSVNSMPMCQPQHALRHLPRARVLLCIDAKTLLALPAMLL